MGAKLAPSLANIFMSVWEAEIIFNIVDSLVCWCCLIVDVFNMETEQLKYCLSYNNKNYKGSFTLQAAYDICGSIGI